MQVVVARLFGTPITPKGQHEHANATAVFAAFHTTCWLRLGKSLINQADTIRMAELLSSTGADALAGHVPSCS
jgi:hypothetical protein